MSIAFKFSLEIIIGLEDGRAETYHFEAIVLFCS